VENVATIANVREAVAKLDSRVRTVVVQSNAPAEPETADSNFRVLPYPLLSFEQSSESVLSFSSAYHSVFTVAGNLGARGCAVIASDLARVTPEWIYRLTQPLIELDFDLVTPAYTRRKFEGLLNSSIVAPLTRALYGKQIQHPLGPDFGFSGRLVRKFLGDSTPEAPRKPRPLTSLTVDAVCDGFEVCQAHLGNRLYPPTDWLNQSSLLAQILDPLFVDIAQDAVFWQRIRGSQPVASFGDEPQILDEPAPPDVSRMIDSFQLGWRNLQDVWGIVLPPGTLLELNKLARLAPGQFRMSDPVWVRIIYDFALGHRLRMISPDHLLRAMTPLYLAWVASFAIETDGATPAAVDHRLEQLSRAYEAGKPYVLSRWRWPDRFNP
jgi:hypothetical protein